MELEIRPFQQEDFDVLLDLTNQAVPFAPQENEEWLEMRKAFNENERVRSHYLAYDNADQSAKGYGCIEQQGDDTASMRIYVVCSPANLSGKVGNLLFHELFQRAKELNVTTLWAREFQADVPIRQFFIHHGFVETQIVRIPDYLPMVVFKRQI